MATEKETVGPRTVFLEVLYGCNLYCSYCYVGREANHRRPVVPDVTTIGRVLDVLASADVEELVLLGGEPLLHPGIEAICHGIAARGFPVRGVVTNGTVVTDRVARLLKDTGFWVDISFRGPDSATFDGIAGKQGAFEKAFEAARLLSRYEVTIGIEYDCIPENYDKLYDTVVRLIEAEVRIKQLQLHRISPAGDAQARFGDFALTLAQWRVVFEQAARIRDELKVPVVFEDGFPLCLVASDYWDMITPCPCGYTLLTIDPAGEARPCSCRGAVLGNVLEDPLSTIWQQRLAGYRAPARHEAACLECDVFEACRGGCGASGDGPLRGPADLFSEHFRPIKLADEPRPAAKLIVDQGVVSVDELAATAATAATA
jgi:radical SAM protein with 4Fe4S-binding SPASM domain